MVPGSPDGAVACVAGGKRHVVAGSKLAELLTEVNDLPRLGKHAVCTLDLGTTWMLFFDYPSGPSQLVTVQMYGCGATSNGQTSTRRTSPDLSQFLLQLGSTTRLHVSGAFKTSTSSSVPGSGFGCGMHQGRLVFESDAMRLEPGTGVARVDIILDPFTGPGMYKATEPRQPYRRTPVQVVTASNAATGAGEAFFIATSGHVTVSTGSPSSPREASGFLWAHLIQQGASATLDLSGSWSCARAR